MQSSCIPHQEFCLIQGQDLIVRIPVYDCEGNPVPLAGAALKFGIAPSPHTPYTIDVDTTFNENEIIATITHEQSEAMTSGRRYYSVWVDMGNDKTIVARGNINVESDSRSL